MAGEAELLKKLRHPGIPIIYDLEADSNYYYLIEEYLDGESLHALIEREGCLTRARLIQWGIQLCQIIYYLHSFEPNPILYLDLQPGNILICRETLKLIDFDQAVFASLAGNLRLRYGTRGFAAPEQYTGETLDVRTDIYAIGALLYYMGAGHFPEGEDMQQPNMNGELAAIIGRCLRRQKEARYQSVQEVLEALMQLNAGAFTENGLPLLKIAAAGSRGGVGVTHVAMSAACWLTRRGVSCLYREKNTSGAVRKMAAYRGGVPDRCGIYGFGDLAVKPWYGQNVRLEQPHFDVVIDDFGTGLQTVSLQDYALVLLVCGTGEWELEDTVQALRHLAHVYIRPEQVRSGLSGGGMSEKRTASDWLRVLINWTAADTRIPFPDDVRGLSFFRMPCLMAPGEGGDDGFFASLFRQTIVEERLLPFQGQMEKRKRRWSLFGNGGRGSVK
jgi:hypothetical protein